MPVDPPPSPLAGRSWVATGGGPHPLVAVHTWRDETPRFDRLAVAAGVDVVSLLPPSPGDGALPRRTAQWVDHHVATLRSTPVEPPYRLIGWSFGGVVAVEVARRLRAEGLDVAYVGMIDTMRPRLVPLSTREYVWFHLAAAAAMTDDRERAAYLKQRARALAFRRFPRAGKAVLAVLERAGLRDERAPRPATNPTDPLQVAVHVSYLNYRGGPVPFPVSLYATEATTARSIEPVLRWNGWLQGGYELVAIPGGHFSLWDLERVGALGGAVRHSLSRIDHAAPVADVGRDAEESGR